jgi:DNA transposition AAA+ family ATPase
MNQQEIQEVRAKALRFMEKHTMSQASFANHVNVSPTTMSQFIRELYSGNLEEICTKITDFIDLEVERQETPSDFDFVETSVAIQVRDALNIAKKTRRPVIITSQPGDGKTEALNHYADSQTILITCRSTMNTLNLMGELASRVKVSTKNSTDHILRRIATSFVSKPRTLIIDEAQHLRPRSLDAIRYIWDMAKIPVMLSGNDELVQTLQSDARLAQILSRLTYMKILRISYEDAVHLIQQRFPGMAPQTMRKLYDTSQSTRMLCDFIVTLHIICKNKNIKIPTPEIIKQVTALKFAA